MIGQILDELIVDCYPDMSNIQSVGDINKFSALLEKFYGLIHGVTTNNINLENICILRFWTDLTILVA